MSWPLASHFSTMLQNPRVAFRDPQLQQCSILKNTQNQPRPWAGAFAVVYKGLSASGRAPFAVRVFTTESPERRERYGLVSSYLKDRKLKCLVNFEYRDRGIRSAGDGKWYPLILMEWVEGETLFQWVRARSLEGNTEALAVSARRWIDVVRELNEVAIAHGDLQHANVMVTTQGELKLVDYDCMCVPALVGRRNLEVGVEPYQHPGRNESTLLSLDLDNFSALVVYTGLRALAADPTLWRKYVEEPGYDKILFRSEDFRVPSSSALYNDLIRSPQQDVRELTQKLFGFACVRMDQVPSLSHLTNSYAKIEMLLKRKHWAEAVKALNRRGQFRDAPEKLKPLIRQAYEHVCRQQAWQAFQKLPQETSEENDRRLVAAWNEALFAGYEQAERQRVRVAEARRRVRELDRICHLVQRTEQQNRQASQSSEKITLIGEQSIVDAADKLPQGYRYSLRPRAEEARRRVAAVARLERALTIATAEASIVVAWRAVVEAKCEGLANPTWRPRIELAERRAPVLKQLYEIPDDLAADQRDARILDFWQEDLLAECREAERWRVTCAAAIARRQVLEHLQAAVEQGNESAIAGLMGEPCLADYPLPEMLATAIHQVRDRLGRTDSLLAALSEGRRSAFWELFDARLIRQHADRFAPHEAVLREWTVTEVLPLERLGLARMSGRRSVKGTGTKCRVRWVWPEERFTNRCLLGVCPAEPDYGDDPQDLVAHHRASVDRETWEREGRRQVIRTAAEWAGSCAVVWAVVDLGFRTFYSPPLVLGHLGTRAGWKWKGLFASRGVGASGAEQQDKP
ncbi:MAG: protein kinase family protein [Pirellulales bacterium]|nr:protein kinase family protein [Pirellulales bacterium]